MPETTDLDLADTTQPAAVSVIIPIYRGLEETRACVESVLISLPYNLSIAQIILVNDASPEPELIQYIESLDHSKITLLNNQSNCGFVASVNRGMAVTSHDVILLNSDTEVFGNWVERLQANAYSDKAIATVTPFSNNATLCSFPNINEDNDLAFGQRAQVIDHAFIAAGQSVPIDIPVGVGFCLYIKRQALVQLGLFDQQAFGKGYGEECDFCCRAALAGWRNVLAGNVFVYHKGAVSFAENRHPLMDAAQQVIDRRYPHYRQSVHQFITQDPSYSLRCAVLFNLMVQDSRIKALIVTHNLGGGVAYHIQDLHQHLQADMLYLVLKPHRNGAVQLSFADRRIKQQWLFLSTDLSQALLLLLQRVGVSFVHFHHFIGLDRGLWSLAQQLDCEYDVTMHDFYSLNGSPAQITRTGRYVGDLSEQERDRLAFAPDRHALKMSAAQWRQTFQHFFKQARYLITPSLDCAQRMRTAFPDLHFISAWHPDADKLPFWPIASYRAQSHQPLVVAVLGILSKEKGADLLEQVAQLAAQQQQTIRFHLIGCAHRRLRSVIEQGRYPEGEAMAQLHAVQPDLVWFPAQCAETYSYTLSSALQAGYPILAPRIGAFPERLQGRAQCYLIDVESSPTQCLAWLIHYHTHSDVLEADHDPTQWLAGGGGDVQGEDLSVAVSDTHPELRSFYHTRYLSGLRAVTSAMRGYAEWPKQRPAPSLVEQGFKYKLLSWLVTIRHARYSQWLVQRIPIRWQQAIKNKLLH